MAPPQLPTRPLGTNGPKVPALGLGLMGLSAFYGTPPPDSERLAFLDSAYELGATFWDSADMYADNEDLLGKWFAANSAKRKDIFLATKFGNKWTKGPDGNVKMETDSSGPYVREAFEKSVKRMGVEKVDLYYCHRVDGKTPIEETVKVMAELKKEGKISYLGLSEVSSNTLRRAHAIHPIAAVQIEYSPFSVEIESTQTNLLKTCRELGVAIVAYSPLGRGMVSGAYRSPDDFPSGDFRKNMPRFSPENFPKNLKLVEGLEKIAEKKGVTPSQLTLAWLLAQGEDIFPIPGTKKVKYLEENLGALKVKLTKEEDGEIRKLVDTAEVYGTRYPEAMMGALFANTPALKA